jgi:predicted negative regulator of RcsB-dependent stress response
MAKELDLQEQEQIDALKAFWKTYGNLITWLVTLVLAAFAAFNVWQWHERSQAQKASSMFGELELAAVAGDADRASHVFDDMKSAVPKTTFAQQAGLLAAKVQNDKGRAADAMASLQWVADNGNEENADVARLRLAGLLADGKKYDDALRQLGLVKTASFAALVADRRGDVLLAKGDAAGAKTAYQAAYDGLPAAQQYRILVEAKLNALGVTPAASAASGAAQ